MKMAYAIGERKHLKKRRKQQANRARVFYLHFNESGTASRSFSTAEFHKNLNR
jgi:hypothetical protein